MTTAQDSYELAASVQHLASPAALAAYLPEGHATGGYIRRPHLDLINQLIVDCVFNRLPEGQGNRLIINIAPQSGKSTLTSLWTPVWINELIAWGVLPRGIVGFATYEGTLAKSWGRKAREAINRNKDLLRARMDNTTTAMDEWETTQGGGMIARGMGGAFTGRPGRYMIVDDLNKGETIYSEVERDEAWSWWLGVGAQRIHPDAPVMVLQARLHTGDFSGRLRSNDYEGDPADWMVVSIPSLAEEETQPDPLGRSIGQPLYRPDVEHTEKQAIEFWRKKEEEVGPFRALGQYRQRPTPPGGALFKRSSMQSWMSEGEPLQRRGFYLLPTKGSEEVRRIKVNSCMRFAIFDLATSIKDEADFTVAGVFDLTPHWDLLLIDIYRDKVESQDRLRLMQSVNRQWQPNFIGIEAIGFQVSDVQHAKRIGLPIKPITAKGDKWARALSPSARMAAGQIYFHPSASWLGSFVTELLEFPGGTHDDQVDVLSYASIAADEIASKSGWSKG